MHLSVMAGPVTASSASVSACFSATARLQQHMDVKHLQWARQCMVAVPCGLNRSKCPMPQAGLLQANVYRNAQAKGKVSQAPGSDMLKARLRIRAKQQLRWAPHTACNDSSTMCKT